MKCKCGNEWKKDDDGSFYTVNGVVNRWHNIPRVCKYCPDCGDELAKLKEDYEPGLYEIMGRVTSMTYHAITDGSNWRIIDLKKGIVESPEHEFHECYEVIRKINEG